MGPELDLSSLPEGCQSSKPMTERHRRFDKVWVRTTPPQMGFDAFASTSVGILTFDPDHVTFSSPGVQISIEEITKVSAARVGNDRVNRWIIVALRNPDGPSELFIKDGTWRGWKPLLTRSNRPILRAFQDYMVSR